MNCYYLLGCQAKKSLLNCHEAVANKSICRGKKESGEYNN